MGRVTAGVGPGQAEGPPVDRAQGRAGQAETFAVFRPLALEIVFSIGADEKQAGRIQGGIPSFAR